MRRALLINTVLVLTVSFKIPKASGDISLDTGQTNSYSLSLQNAGELLLLAAMVSAPGMPGRCSGLPCRQRRKEVASEISLGIEGSNSEPKRQTDP